MEPETWNLKHEAETIKDSRNMNLKHEPETWNMKLSEQAFSTKEIEVPKIPEK
jgi:hypothetical protein